MAKANHDELTPKQKLFVAEYLKDLNATQAAIRAGYSKKTARVQGARLLTYAAIAAAVKQGTEKKLEKAELTAGWVVKNLQEVAERCMQAVPVMEKVDGELVETGEYKFDSSGANRSLELLGKHLGIFVEKVEHTIVPYEERLKAIHERSGGK